MNNPYPDRPSTKTCNSLSVADSTENDGPQIDEQMSLLVRRFGELVGRAVATIDQTAHHQNDILKNLDSE